MNAIIITIGDELLNGQTIDTNSAYIARALNLIGVSVWERIAIGDDEIQILEALTKASKVAEIVITTGGLGPTKDDITKKTICHYFNVGYKRDEATYNHVQEIFKSRNRPFLEVNKLQADIPTNANVMFNKMGTAPGMHFFENNVHYFSMPGVPYEMKYLLDACVIPILKEKLSLPVIVHRFVQTVGIGESFLADKISTIEDCLPAHIKLAYLPSFGKVTLRLTGKIDSKEKENNLIQEVEQFQKEIKTKIAEYVYNVTENSLAETLGDLLKDKKLMLSAAESCTGGYIAHQLTSIPGSSLYFHGSVVTYSYEMKEEILSVKQQTLATYGAVSEETVLEMVQGLLKNTKANIGVAVSGIAGPSGGTADKPVGTVWIAVGNHKKQIAKKFQFGKERMVNIEYSAVYALDMCRKFILEEYPDTEL